MQARSWTKFSTECMHLCHLRRQVDFVKMLYDQMVSMHTQFADTPRGINFPRPSFKVRHDLGFGQVTWSESGVLGHVAACICSSYELTKDCP